MASSVRLIEPRSIQPNPENPRLVFREEELLALQESIRSQGILVPLTVYEVGRSLFILDGERRWRCALRLGLTKVPVIVQPEPTKLQNIMMMFAIHNARRDWDPLPTAYKLRDLENEFEHRQGRRPTETELAELSSLSRGTVRRLKNLLDLPKEYHEILLNELKKPRSEQVLTVDYLLEAQRGVSALAKRDIIPATEEQELIGVLIKKFESRVINNTVAPRQLARIARAVERDEVPIAIARRVTRRLITEELYGIEDAFKDSIEQVDFEHTVEQLADRLIGSLQEHQSRGYVVGDSLRAALLRLTDMVHRLIPD